MEAREAMKIVLIALVMIASGLLLWPWRRRQFDWDLGELHGALTSPLARQLWRQSVTPQLGPPAGSALLPVFSFDLYPTPMRELYDHSRELDARLLRALLKRPGDRSLRVAVEALQRRTRAARRRLMVALVNHHDELEVIDLSDLKRSLEDVDRAVEVLMSV